MKSNNKVPKDWQIIKLNNLFETIPNLSNAREDLTDIAQKVMYIHYGDIHTNSIHEKIDLQEDTLPYLLDNKIEKDINDMLLKNGDVIITDASEDYEGIAKSVEITNINNKKVVAGLHTIVLRPIKNIVSIGYGSYLLQMPITSKKLKSISQGTKVISISFQLIKDLDLFLPPIKEQEKIVEILELWDKAIETTKKLIEQKQLQKKYLMQKLLTGKIRLKGFKDKWKNMIVDDLLTERKEFSIKTEEYPLMAFIANKGIAEKGDRYNREFLVNNEVDKKYKRTEYGDFIYSSNNLETGSIGVNTFGKATISPVYSIFFTKENTNSSFIGYILTQKEFINKMIKWRQGVTYGQWKIHETDFLKIKIRIPNLLEQNEIVKVLSTADNQINLLEQKLSKLELEKKGLMQKFLTGEIRVGR